MFCDFCDIIRIAETVVLKHKRNSGQNAEMLQKSELIKKGVYLNNRRI